MKITRLTEDQRQDLEHWPLRYLNAVAIPLALALAVFVDSFPRALLIGIPIGFIAGGVMGALWISNLRRLVSDTDDPLLEFRAMREAPRSRDPRFVFGRLRPAP